MPDNTFVIILDKFDMLRPLSPSQILEQSFLSWSATSHQCASFLHDKLGSERCIYYYHSEQLPLGLAPPLSHKAYFVAFVMEIYYASVINKAIAFKRLALQLMTVP